MASQSNTQYPMPNMCYDGDWRNSEHEKKMRELQDISDALPIGKLKGFVWSSPIADGKAHYLVVFDNGKSVKLQHIPYADCWQVPDALIRGLRRADVLEAQGWRKHLIEAFSRAKK